MRYLIFQEEIGDSGTYHLQGYIEMNSPVRFTAFHPLLERAHFEVAMGTPQQCSDYCSKEDSRVGGPYIFGTLTKQGQRSDVLSLRDAVKSGKRGRDLFDDDTTAVAAIKYTRGVERMVDAYTPKIGRDNISVTFHFGPAGTGKTRCCHTDDAYYFDGNNGFWNGYQGETKA